MARTKVYIVGAGPGDWQLISVKGLNALKKADVILYDFLSSKELLSFAKKGCHVICCGKSDGLHLLEQGQINKIVYKFAKQGKMVVRLKGGDPFLFSRGIEEALYLKRKGINFEIIPGISSAFAACESFGIPLTRKGRYSSIALLTGRKSNTDKLDAPDCDTLIYLMAVKNINSVVRTILRSGRSLKTPCAFIERGATEKERIVCGNLGNIAELARRFKIVPPSVLVVGKIIEYGRKIHGFKFK